MRKMWYNVVKLSNIDSKLIFSLVALDNFISDSSGEATRSHTAQSRQTALVFCQRFRSFTSPEDYSKHSKNIARGRPFPNQTNSVS